MSAYAAHPSRLTRMIQSKTPLPTVQPGTFRTSRLLEIVDADGGNASTVVNAPGVRCALVETTVDDLLKGRYVLFSGFVLSTLSIIGALLAYPVCATRTASACVRTGDLAARMLVPADRMTLFFA